MTDIDALLSRGFRQGTESAKEAASRGPSSRKVDFLRMDDTDLIFCRFLTDYYEIMDVMVHTMYPTKPKPDGSEGNWPKTISAVCRNTKMGDGQPMFPDGCYCCQHPRLDDGKPRAATPRTYGLLVLREEVMSDGSEKFVRPGSNPPQIIPKGQRAGFRDKKREYQGFDFNTNQPVGAVEMIPDVMLAEYGWNNFWVDIEGIQQLFGTVCNQEMTIRRTGKGMNDTKYHIVGLGITAHDMRDPAVLAKYGIEVVGFDDMGRPLKKYPPEYSLPHMLYNRASDDYYARWIDPTKTVERGTAGVEQVVTKAPQEEVSQASLEAMRARLQSSQAPPVEAPPLPVAPAAVVSEPAPAVVAPAPVPDPAVVAAQVAQVAPSNGYPVQPPQAAPPTAPPTAGDMNFE
jgi:hypothetical protein